MIEHEIISNLACTYCRLCNLVDPVEGEPCKGTGPSYAALRERVQELEKEGLEFCRDRNSARELVQDLSKQLATLTTAHQQAVAKEWMYCPECGCEDYKSGIDGERECTKCTQSWFPHVNYHNAVRVNLATMKASLQQAVEALAGVRGKLERLQQFVDSGQLMKNYKAMEAAWADARDVILNERGPLAEMNAGNDVINAVLGILDDAQPRGEAGHE